MMYPVYNEAAMCYIFRETYEPSQTLIRFLISTVCPQKNKRENF